MYKNIEHPKTGNEESTAHTYPNRILSIGAEAIPFISQLLKVINANATSLLSEDENHIAPELSKLFYSLHYGLPSENY
jgi:hypothetical protein